MPARILVVHADQVALQRLQSILENQGFAIAAVASFTDARDLFDTACPDLLIADIRLDAFNGLHLAVRARLDLPSLPIIITHNRFDAVLEKETHDLGATYVVNPLDNPSFLRSVRLALDSQRRELPDMRRWPRKQPHDAVEAQVADARVRVIDLSYGGVRLELDDPGEELPPTFEVVLPSAGVTLNAYRVWTRRAGRADELWCGAELADTGTAATSQWRQFVDSISGEQVLAT